MSSDSTNSSNNAGFSEALSSLNIGDGEINNEEKEATDNINTATILCAACGKEGGDNMNICNEEKEATSTDTDIINAATILLCANCCGKEGGESMYICNKCDLVVYCNASCKKKHQPKHKKKCEKRAAEIQAVLHDSDIQLFKQPPQNEDCPICFLPLPSLATGSKYKACCGKDICSGCTHALKLKDKGVGLCPFCRTQTPNSEEEMIEMYKKRVEVAGDDNAMYILGCCYSEGAYGVQQDRTKSLELWHKAGELGNAKAYNNIGYAYRNGVGVERDEKKADHYYELAAKGGVVKARHNLGNSETRAGNWDRAIKHYMIAVGGGDNDSVKRIQQLYMDEHATKEDYIKALIAYQKCIDESRSDQRDKAAAFHDRYKCY